jgi:hypothetical protein
MRARTSLLVLLLALVPLLGGTDPASAAELFGPYVAFDARGGARLQVEDASGRGTLIRVVLVHPDGRPLVHRGHPVVVSRAIPPGETLAVDLRASGPQSFTGCLRLTANRPVRARLDLGTTGYRLLEPQLDGRATLEVTSLGSGVLFVAVQNVEPHPGRVEVLAPGRQGPRRVMDRPLPSDGMVLAELGPWPPRIRHYELDADVGVAAILLGGHPDRLSVVGRSQPR